MCAGGEPGGVAYDKASHHLAHRVVLHATEEKAFRPEDAEIDSAAVSFLAFRFNAERVMYSPSVPHAVLSRRRSQGTRLTCASGGRNGGGGPSQPEVILRITANATLPLESGESREGGRASGAQ